MRRIWISIFILACAASLRAAPLDRRHLPAEVKWFIHVDVDAARASVVGQAILDAMRLEPGVMALRAKFREHFNSDPTQDLRGITVFGTELTPEASVLVVRGRVDREKVLDMLRQAQDFQTESYGAHEIYSWSEGGTAARQSHGAFADSDTLMISASGSAVKGALDVLDGKSQSLARDSLLAEPAPAGSIVEAAALGLADARELPIQSPLLRQTDFGRFSAGEFQGLSFAHALAGTRAPQVAEKVRALVAGMLALAQLSGEGSDAGKLLATVQVKSEGDAVKVDWQMPADQVALILVGEVRKAVSATRPAETEGKP